VSSPPDQTVTRLTHQGFQVSGPRFDRFSCRGCPPDVLYSAINANGFPSLYRVALDGSEPQRVTTRYFGSTTAIGREAVYFDQMEVRRNTGFYSDLYEWSRQTGRVRQITREARLLDPDLSPDGRTLVCVQNRAGQRDLVLVRPRPETTLDITILVGEPDTHFNAPKWSPDGRTIAVERHRLGAMPEIVLVDVATRTTRVVPASKSRRSLRMESRLTATKRARRRAAPPGRRSPWANYTSLGKRFRRIIKRQPDGTGRRSRAGMLFRPRNWQQCFSKEREEHGTCPRASAYGVGQLSRESQSHNLIWRRSI